jgi:thiamine biosynthesis lipoprotein
MSLRALLTSLTILACAGGTVAEAQFKRDVSDSMTSLQGDAFGTRFTIKVALAPGTDLSPQFDRSVAEALDRLNGQMSLWDDGSELSRFNRHAGVDWFPVSDELVTVVQAASRIRQTTGGGFDPTVRPLLSIWSFGPGDRPKRVPSQEEIRAAQSLAGVDIDIRREPEPALRKQDPRVELDLNAIAKGYAVDAVAGLVESLNPLGYMVEIGGEVRTSGVKRDGTHWRIAIERPVIGERASDVAVDLGDTALATSGDYRNYFEAGGQRYSHTIDPRTGRPITHTLASVSVVAEDCMTADAWATALMVLGPEAGYTLAEKERIAAMFLIREGEAFRTQTTAGFPDLIPLGPPMTAESPLSTFLLAAAVFGVAIVGMSIGVILAGRRLRGSCGGLAGLKDEHGNPLCDACTNPAEKCEELRKQMAQEVADQV